MSCCTSMLNQLNLKLKLPQPVKSKIMLEIASDMNEMYDRLLSKGMKPETAYENVCEKFMLSDSVIDELNSLHKPLIQAWLFKLPEQWRNLLEKILFGFVIFIILITTGKEILSTQFFTNASQFVWPVLAAGLTALVIGIVKTYQLWIKRNHQINTIRQGVPLLLVLSAFSLFMAVFGYIMELFLLGEETILFASNILMVLILNTDIAAQWELLETVANWLMRSSAMMMVGMAIAVLAALIWYIIMKKVVSIESAELAFFLEP